VKAFADAGRSGRRGRPGVRQPGGNSPAT
jgi:hypothetical protein